jgi:hypothetical protein
MGATVQWLRHRIVFLLGREAEARDLAEHNAPPRRENDTGAARLTVHEIEANERDRAERFRRDQLLPIVGLVGSPN